MNILHGTWIPKEQIEFIRTGAFYLWVETCSSIKSTKPNKKNIHPNHLSKDDLLTFITGELGMKPDTLGDIKSKISYKYFTLPSNELSPMPSPQCLKYQGEGSLDDYKLAQWEICCFELDHPIRDLNDIAFIALYNDDIQLGADLLFWDNYLKSLKDIIVRDQYIPALKYREINNATGKKKTTGFEIYPAWEIISEQYESLIQQYLQYMPILCAAGSDVETAKNNVFSREKLLRHFSECIVNHIATQTKYNAKIEGMVKGTFLEGCINAKDKNEIDSIPDALEQYHKWQIWRQKLSTVSTETRFILCFQLSEPTDGNPNLWQIDFVISSKDDPSLKMRLSQYWTTYEKSKKFVTEHFGGDFEKALLLNLGYSARIYSKIWDGLETDTPTGITLNLQEAYEFLKERAWILQDAGYKIIIPSWWTPQGQKKIKIRLKTSAGSKKDTSSASSGYFTLNSIIDFKYELSIGGESVTEKEWKSLIDAKTPFVKFRGQWIELNKDKMSQMLEFWQNRTAQNPQISLIDMIKLSSEPDIEFDHSAAIDEMLAGLYDINKLDAFETPRLFKGALRQYQKRGVSWLQYLERLGLNPCLADDMGLGKTIQVISLIINEREGGQQQLPTLLVAPTSVLGNWEKEVERFAPHLKLHIHHGSSRIKHEDEFIAKSLSNDIIVTSFALIRKDKNLFQTTEWNRIVIDEAQNIKNPNSAQTKSVMKLNARHKIALTGTPIENRLLDLWSIFNFLNPGYLGGAAQFKKIFEIPIQRDSSLTQSTILKKLIQPFILRRIKTDKDIIKDLPDKVEQKVFCNLTKEQASLYEAAVKDVASQIENSEGIQRKGLMLSTLMKLKQICNHPAQFLQDDSEFTVERSHKLERLSEMIAEVIENGESLLIFSQFKEICDSLVKYARNRLHYNTYYIHGGVARTKRQQMIEEFQDMETEPSVFILSLKAGGVGVTLTKANHVFHFDRWWNPAVEDQATDRAFRIGQKKNVFIHKFIAIGTVEERIDAMIEDKKKLSTSIVGADESWLTELDNKTFIKLIQLNKNTIMESE